MCISLLMSLSGVSFESRGCSGDSGASAVQHVDNGGSCSPFGCSSVLEHTCMRMRSTAVLPIVELAVLMVQGASDVTCWVLGVIPFFR